MQIYTTQATQTDNLAQNPLQARFEPRADELQKNTSRLPKKPSVAAHGRLLRFLQAHTAQPGTGGEQPQRGEPSLVCFVWSCSCRVSRSRLLATCSVLLQHAARAHVPKRSRQPRAALRAGGQSGGNHPEVEQQRIAFALHLGTSWASLAHFAPCQGLMFLWWLWMLKRNSCCGFKKSES